MAAPGRTHGGLAPHSPSHTYRGLSRGRVVQKAPVAQRNPRVLPSSANAWNLRKSRIQNQSESGDVDQEPSKGRTYQPESSRNPEALDEPSDQSGYRRGDYRKKLESQISSINRFQRLVFRLHWCSLVEICTPNKQHEGPN